MWIRAVIQTSEQKYFRNVSKTYLHKTDFTQTGAGTMEINQP